MINRLWVRLSLAFALVGLVEILVVAVAYRHAEIRTPDWETAVAAFLNEPHGLVEELVTSYEATGNWDEAKRLLNERQAHYASVLNAEVHFDLMDLRHHNLIYSTAAPPVTHPEGEMTIPIGPAKPYALLRLAVSGIIPEDTFHALMVTLFFSFVFSIVLGMIFSRTQTRPLAELAATAHALREHDLDRRAVVQGSVEIIEVAQAFNAMAEGLQRSEMLRRNLVADVAHELRTPLTVLQSRLYGILDDVYQVDKAQITALYEQTRLLSRLVNDLQELSCVEANQLPLNKHRTNLQPLLEDTLTTFQMVTKDKNITLKTMIPESLPLVEVDEERINQVIFNLVTNALRHTPEEGTITVRVYDEDSMLKVEVRDYGEGIAPEHLPHIFERFYRADPSRQRSSGGTGLGLAIAKSIVEAHGGTLTAASEGIPGWGTVFTMGLPVVR